MNYLIISADKLQERINLEISSLESAAEELIQERDNEEEAGLRLEKAKAYKDILELIKSLAKKVTIPAEDDVREMAFKEGHDRFATPIDEYDKNYLEGFTDGAKAIINLLK